MADRPADGRTGRERLLYDLGCAFAARIELDELVSLVIEQCREVLESEGASVLLLDAESNELYFPYAVAEDPQAAEKLARLRLPADQGIAGLVLRTGEAVRLDDASSDPRLYRDVDRETGTSTKTLLAAPLRTRQGAGSGPSMDQQNRTVLVQFRRTSLARR